MKETLKSKKGITLIALVIIIIILIILAGISISLLMREDGLITKAKQGALNYQNASLEEQKMLNNFYGNFASGDIYEKDVDRANRIYDEEAPNVTITMSNSEDYLFAVKSIVSITDASGVDYNNCKYIYTTNNTPVGDNISSYTEGSLTEANTTIEKSKSPATYYLHVFATDINGNASETISQTGVTIASVANFSYATDTNGNGIVQTVNLKPGNYKFECWGAQGGTSGNGIGGKGGYSIGNKTFNADTIVNICVGGKGINNDTSLAYEGYNGGGNGSGENKGDGLHYDGSGGGATHIALKNGTTYSTLESYENENIAKQYVLLVAGGGGGAYNHGPGDFVANGGVGGGTSGGNGSNSSSWTTGYGAQGGTQNSGGAGGDITHGYTPNNGKFGKGGNGGSRWRRRMVPVEVLVLVHLEENII